MGGLSRLLTRPLWREDARARTARRIRHALVTPVMVFAGVIWGALATPTPAGGLGWAVGGAVGFSLLAYLYLRLQPALLEIGYERVGAAGWLAGLLWDWLVVGGVVYLITDVLGMPTFRAVTSAVVIGGSYGLALASFFDEGGSRFLSGFLSGGWGRPRVAFSHIETMLTRGEDESARAALRDFVRSHPRDPRGWIALARLVARRFHDADAAVAILREGLGSARLTVQQKQRYLDEIVRACAALGAPGRAVPDLERFAEEHDGSAQAEWARSVLQRTEA